MKFDHNQFHKKFIRCIAITFCLLIHSSMFQCFLPKDIASLISLIGASLSEPHTSGKNGTRTVFTKIYMEIQINGTSIMHSQKVYV